ncbi:MAG: hypothetical protein ACON4E_00030 [Flavobacteriales bacterium]
MKINAISQGYLGIGLFLVFTTVAMIMYPGGTIHDSNTVGYQFFYNFFSNLGEWTARNGEPNKISAYLFNSALMILALSYFVFYYQFLKILSKNLDNSILRISLISTIVISMVSFVLVAVFSGEAETHELHVLFVKIAFRVLLLHAVLQVISMFKIKTINSSVKWVTLFFTLILVGFILVMDFGPNAWDGNQALFIQVTAQKVIVYSILTYFFFQLNAAKSLSLSQNE